MPNPLAPHEYQSTPSVAPRAAAGRGGLPFCASDLTQYSQPVENLICKYPGAALASAFFVGVLVAWLIKRK